jgi:hypothetical protein
MKKYRCYGGLLLILLLISASCSSLTLNIKDQSPATKKANHTQAVILALQTTPDKKSSPLLRFLKKYIRNIIGLLGLLWLWLLARFYITEKSRRVPGWKLEDIALLKIIKDNAVRLWNNHRPDRKIIRLEDWRR